MTQEDGGFNFEYSDSQIQELWLIVTYCHGPLDETLPKLQGPSIKKPCEEADSWEYCDMVHCAFCWCLSVLDLWRDQTNQQNRDSEAVGLWNAFKAEFRLLACTQDKKYKDLRAQISKLAGEKAQLAIVSALASGIAVHMGITVSTILTPLCAICCLAGGRIGREILCQRLLLPNLEDIGVDLGDEKSPARAK